MTGVVFVYDDTVEVAESLRELTGIERHGALRFRRRRLGERMDGLARAAGYRQRLALTGRDHIAALLGRLERGGLAGRLVLMTADLAMVEDEPLELFLARLAYADGNLLAAPAGGPPGSLVASLEIPVARDFLAALLASGRRAAAGEIAGRVEPVPLPAGMVSLTDPDEVVRFVTGAFDTRAFNAIRQAGGVVVKASADKDKIRREHDYWTLLPPPAQRFFVQPFDYRDDGATASYRLERLNVPDAALQWIHGSVDAPALGCLLDAAFAFLGAAPRREVGAAAARAAAEAAYCDKLDQRMARLMALPLGRRLSAILAEGTEFAGLPELAECCKDRLRRRLAAAGGTTLALQHGDLCFSNILFDRRTRLVKFIDPRGAATADQLWGDPTYDLAKLSHSILGGYDFINNEAFEVGYDEALRLRLTLDAPPLGPCRALFLERVAAAGFDPALVRLAEASLFLSMLPLHVEAPRKLLAYALVAASILREDQAPAEGVLATLWRALKP